MDADMRKVIAGNSHCHCGGVGDEINGAIIAARDTIPARVGDVFGLHRKVLGGRYV